LILCKKIYFYLLFLIKIKLIKENYKSNYIDEGEVYPGEKGLSEVEILGKEFTSFLILVGIYFPSVTGSWFKSFW